MSAYLESRPRDRRVGTRPDWSKFHWIVRRVGDPHPITVAAFARPQVAQDYVDSLGGVPFYVEEVVP